jgi:hypothetical protein
MTLILHRKRRSGSQRKLRGVYEWFLRFLCLAIGITIFFQFQLEPALTQPWSTSSSSWSSWSSSSHPSSKSLVSSWNCPRDTNSSVCNSNSQQLLLLELQAKLNVEDLLEQEMIANARERSDRDVYDRKNPNKRQERHADYFLKVQQTLLPPQSLSAPKESWRYNSFADLSIMGFPKTGTSHLYKILASHTRAVPIFKRKEFCMDHGHFMDYVGGRPQQITPAALTDLQKKLWRYHRNVHVKRQNATLTAAAVSTKKVVSINACLQPSEVEYHAAYVPLPQDAKFIFMFRDPADWLWASWNFWIDKAMDLPRPLPQQHDWASPGVHYRSPELFHELILSQGKLKSAGNRFQTMREMTVLDPRRIMYLVGKQNVLFLKNEDLQPHRIQKEVEGGSGGFLHKLAEFTGLEESQFNDTVLVSRSNCNNQKGYEETCNDTTIASSSSTTGAAYEITHRRGMLDRTRHLIYLQFHEECNVWTEEFGIVYRDCLDALSNPSANMNMN